VRVRATTVASTGDVANGSPDVVLLDSSSDEEGPSMRSRKCPKGSEDAAPPNDSLGRGPSAVCRPQGAAYHSMPTDLRFWGRPGDSSLRGNLNARGPPFPPPWVERLLSARTCARPMSIPRLKARGLDPMLVLGLVVLLLVLLLVLGLAVLLALLLLLVVVVVVVAVVPRS